MHQTSSILVTGGAGFIGSNFVLEWIASDSGPIVNLDKLTYAGNALTLASVHNNPLYSFVHGNICDGETLNRLFMEHNFTAVVHFAAESHVDRSLTHPDDFLETNVRGTYQLLQAATRHFQRLDDKARSSFRFLHVSTDEVFGSLRPHDPPFREDTPYAPNSPYAASKAASDHLVRAWHHSYGLPTLITNCSNNYGPRQFPEKLIPLVLLRALAGDTLPIYGDGLQVRDWLYVSDHCDAIRTVLQKGVVGETYNIGGNNQMTNLATVTAICDLLDEESPLSGAAPRTTLIKSVPDRPGHDRRYAMDTSKIARELGWRPQTTFETGLRKTVAWYLSSSEWIASVTDGSYRDWIDTNYSNRTISGRMA